MLAKQVYHAASPYIISQQRYIIQKSAGAVVSGGKKSALAICAAVYYNESANRTEALWLQRQECQAVGLQKGMGSKSPHLTNTVGTEKGVR